MLFRSDVGGMTRAERLQYDEALKKYRDTISVFEGVRLEGREEGLVEVIENMLRKGKTPQEIVDFCGFELDIVEQVQESLLARTK